MADHLTLSSADIPTASDRPTLPLGSLCALSAGACAALAPRRLLHSAAACANYSHTPPPPPRTPIVVPRPTAAAAAAAAAGRYSYGGAGMPPPPPPPPFPAQPFPPHSAPLPPLPPFPGTQSPPRKRRRWLRWLFALIAAMGASSVFSVVVLLRRMSEERYGAGARYFDLDAYKRGGDLWQPLPPDAPDSVTEQERGAMRRELLQTQMLRFLLHAMRRAEVEPALQRLNIPKSAIGIEFDKNASKSAVTPEGAMQLLADGDEKGEQPPPPLVFRYLHDSAHLTHSHATLLIDCPRNWQTADAVRLQVAREMLQESAQWARLAIDYAKEHASELEPEGSAALKDLVGSKLDALQRTWGLWGHLLDIEARLGQRDESERTAAEFSQLVNTQCDAIVGTNADPGVGVATRQLRAITRHIIEHRRAQLLAVRREWDECAEQQVALLRGMLEFHSSATPRPRSVGAATTPSRAGVAEAQRTSPGEDFEMASTFAALSHARLQQPGSASLRAAVLDAQHAVALINADVDWRTLEQVRAALMSELSETADEVRIGDVPYSELLSPAALDRARPSDLGQLARQRSGLWGLVLSPTVTQTLVLTRISQVAAVYEQLGLALQAAGQGPEAQRAFEFADELASLRPAAAAQPKSSAAAQSP